MTMSIVDKVKEMLGQHPDKAKKAVDKGGDMFDQRTGGKYADKTDMAQGKAGDYIDKSGGMGPQSDEGMPGPNAPH
ncbi:antitoxin [Actinomadura fibrosa]|uniref:Antitoxin n=1 Tax=Actinomadura fibrosa TaxID=111802 RepID=A0ABW2XLU0_9ACTN|nr:antitoxin [Actinomadura fibrosa]